MLPPPCFTVSMLFFRLTASPFLLHLQSWVFSSWFSFAPPGGCWSPAHIRLTRKGASPWRDRLSEHVDSGCKYFGSWCLQGLHLVFRCCLGVQLNLSEQSLFISESSFPEWCSVCAGVRDFYFHIGVCTDVHDTFGNCFQEEPDCNWTGHCI